MQGVRGLLVLIYLIPLRNGVSARLRRMIQINTMHCTLVLRVRPNVFLPKSQAFDPPLFSSTLKNYLLTTTHN